MPDFAVIARTAIPRRRFPVSSARRYLLEKRLRISDPLPSEDDVERIVEKVFDDRRKSRIQKSGA